jgi:hypothetical protein
MENYFECIKRTGIWLEHLYEMQTVTINNKQLLHVHLYKMANQFIYQFHWAIILIEIAFRG